MYTLWNAVTTTDGLTPDRIRTLRVFGTQLWVGMENGLALHEGGQWKRWGAEDGLSWPMISAIDVDEKTHDVWIGTWGGGLIRFSGGRFERFDQFNSGLAGDLVFAVAVNGNRVWAATNGGLSAFEFVRDAWELHAERRADGPETAVVSLCNHEGGLLAASWCGGLRRLDLESRQWTLLGKPSSSKETRRLPPFIERDTTTAVAGAGRMLWRVEQSDVYRRDATGQWDSRRIPTPDPQRSFVHCVAAQDESGVWLGTDDDLLELADWASDTWVSYRYAAKSPAGLATLFQRGNALETRLVEGRVPDGGVRCVALDDVGIWVGTSHGLFRGTQKKRWSLLPVARAEDRQKLEICVMRPAAVTGSPVTIGVVAKTAKTIALPGETAKLQDRLRGLDRYAAQLALAQIDSPDGDPSRRAVDMVMSTSAFTRYGWGLPEDDVPRFAIQRKAVGLVGYLDPDSRILSAVVLKTELPLVNSASTPASIDERVNPWVFRCRSNDPLQHQSLLDHVFDSLHKTRVGILRTESPISQMHVNWWAAHAQNRGHAPVVDEMLAPGGENLAAVVEQLRRAEVDVLLTWCDISTAPAVLRGLRIGGSDAVFIGGDEIVCPEFTTQVGRDAGAVLAPYPCKHRENRVQRAEFSKQYARGWPQRTASVDPELSFDAVHHLLEAVQVAAPNGESLRDTLEEMNKPRMARLTNNGWELCELPHSRR